MIDRPALSIVIPAFDAADTIADTLASIHAPLHPGHGPRVEVLVVDDGSRDKEALDAVLAGFPGVRLLRHERNVGMSAARNTGSRASTGAVVAILDADDRLVPDWPERLREILAAWPAERGACFAGCRNHRGEPTVAAPDYTGPMTLADFLNDRFPGEYFMMFRGDYIRSKGWVDVGTPISCGTLSFIAFLEDGPIWLAAPVMRIYWDDRSGAVSHNAMRPEKARHRVLCTQAIIERHGHLYREHARKAWHGKYLRLAVYRRLAGQPGAWRAFWRGVSIGSLREALGAAILLGTGPRLREAIVRIAKRRGLVKRYG
jgi:glycosyltransferase involved in cell wall biosynthesis